MISLQQDTVWRFLLFRNVILLTLSPGQDLGTADLIIRDVIKVKHGTEPDHFTRDGVVFADGSMLAADLVVFATGYEPIKNTVRNIFGDEVATKVTPVWGLDEEGESRRTFKPSGHPGVSVERATMKQFTENHIEAMVGGRRLYVSQVLFQITRE